MVTMTVDHIGSSEVVGTVGETGSTNVAVRREAGFHIVDAWSKIAVVICCSTGSDIIERVRAIVDAVNRGDEGRVVHNSAATLCEN